MKKKIYIDLIYGIIFLVCVYYLPFLYHVLFLPVFLVFYTGFFLVVSVLNGVIPSLLGDRAREFTQGAAALRDNACECFFSALLCGIILTQIRINCTGFSGIST